MGEIEAGFTKQYRAQFVHGPDLAAGRAAVLEGVKRLKRLPPLYHLVRELRKEMEAGFERSTAVVMAESDPDDGSPRKVVRVRRAKEMKLKAPVLIADGTASADVLRAIRPGIEIHEIDVKRNAHFVQVVDTKLNATSLTKDKAAERNLGRVQAAI